MALRRTPLKRLFSATSRDSTQPITATVLSLSPPPSIPALPNAAKSHHRKLFTFPDSIKIIFFRRFLQRRSINNGPSPNAFPSFLSLPDGEKLREKLSSMNIAGDHGLRLGGLNQPLSTEERFAVSAADARRVLRFVQMEKVTERLRNIPASTIGFAEFVQICGDACGVTGMGLDLVRALDESGNVIVLGGVVFLRPDQVAESIEKLISQSIATPDDPRREELDSLEAQKTVIDQKARSLVRRELYVGLGFLVIQTLGFMRLTFWELTWDVMEPICFFTASLHFALAYAFFLRTSTEPSFEGYFQARFQIKRKRLMEMHGFDLERYHQLCRAFHRNYTDQRCCSGDAFESRDFMRGTILESGRSSRHGMPF